MNLIVSSLIQEDWASIMRVLNVNQDHWNQTPWGDGVPSMNLHRKIEKDIYGSNSTKWVNKKHFHQQFFRYCASYWRKKIIAPTNCYSWISNISLVSVLFVNPRVLVTQQEQLCWWFCGSLKIIGVVSGMNSIEPTSNSLKFLSNYNNTFLAANLQNPN